MGAVCMSRHPCTHFSKHVRDAFFVILGLKKGDGVRFAGPEKVCLQCLGLGIGVILVDYSAFLLGPRHLEFDYAILPMDVRMMPTLIV